MSIMPTLGVLKKFYCQLSKKPLIDKLIRMKPQKHFVSKIICRKHEFSQEGYDMSHQ